MRTARQLSAVAFAALTILSATDAILGQNPFASQIQAANARAALLEDGDLHVVLCGTGGPIFAPDRGGPCTAVLAGGRFFIVDAGEGTTDRLQRLALSADRISGLLVTHFHSDHIAEIGALNFLRWTRGNGRSPLQVWGPEGVDEVVQGFNQAYTLDLGYRRAHHTDAIMPPEGARAEAHAISFAEEETIKVFYDQDGLRITAFLVDHPPIVPAVGYRFDFAGRSVAISGDTVRSQNLVTASRGVDLLIHEAIANNVITLVKPLLEQAGDVRGATILVDALENHTFPPDVFALAQEAGARSLAISHLVPALPAAQARRAFLAGRDAFSGEVWVGEDGQHFTLPAGSEEIRSEMLLPGTPATTAQ